MPAELKQTILRNGEVIPPSQLKVEQTILWSCDSPRCASRHEKTTELSFKRIENENDLEKVPDAFFSIIKMRVDPLNEDAEIAFCSPRCVKDYLDYAYVVPKRPRKVEKDAAQLELPFPEPPIDPITARVE